MQKQKSITDTTLGYQKRNLASAQRARLRCANRDLKIGRIYLYGHSTNPVNEIFLL